MQLRMILNCFFDLSKSFASFFCIGEAFRYMLFDGTLYVSIGLLEKPINKVVDNTVHGSVEVVNKKAPCGAGANYLVVGLLVLVTGTGSVPC